MCCPSKQLGSSAAEHGHAPHDGPKQPTAYLAQRRRGAREASPRFATPTKRLMSRARYAVEKRGGRRETTFHPPATWVTKKHSTAGRRETGGGNTRVRCAVEKKGEPPLPPPKQKKPRCNTHGDVQLEW